MAAATWCGEDEDGVGVKPGGGPGQGESHAVDPGQEGPSTVVSSSTPRATAPREGKRAPTERRGVELPDGGRWVQAGEEEDSMVFSHNKNSNQFDPLSYVNLSGLDADGQSVSFTDMNSRDAPSNSHVSDVGKENMLNNPEESKIASTGLKPGSPISPENFSFSSLPGSSCHLSTLDHGKRPLSDVRPFQVAYLADETREPDYIYHNSGISACNTSSSIPYSNLEQLIGEENLYLPDWVTTFPGYTGDFWPAPVADQVDDIDSPIHDHLPRKAVAIGPDHQADIPEWRPRISMTVPYGSGSCADLSYSSVSTSGSAPRDEDGESDKWIKHCVIEMPSSCSVAWVGDHGRDCGCSDEGSIRCVRRHVLESRENLKRRFGEDKFRELGLCEMGEDIAQRWTDEEESLFYRVVYSNPPSLGKNFWHFLPRALPGKTSMELVSYYFNVFMLRKRAQQNRSEPLHVDSDDDEVPDEPSVTEDEDSAVESPAHDYYVNNPMSPESEDSFHEKVADSLSGLRDGPSQKPLGSNTDNPGGDADVQDESCTSFEDHNGAHGSNGVQCAEFHMMLPNAALDHYSDRGACM
uniref:Myb-like domain-containing protein n=1 Tax=Oryza meridionalis TaxID=40149 RepID=A0A0E0D2B9_9ORYZ